MVYGVPRDRVIGSAIALSRTMARPTAARSLRRPEADVLDDGPQKPVRMWSRVGRRRLLAAGNSNGDVAMLEFAGGRRAGRRFGCWCGTTTPTARSPTRLGRSGRWSAPAPDGWTEVSVKHDWATVFPA